jgi:hypothetical protein
MGKRREGERERETRIRRSLENSEPCFHFAGSLERTDKLYHWRPDSFAYGQMSKHERLHVCNLTWVTRNTWNAEGSEVW